VTNGTTYYYEVVALNGTVTSPASNEVSARPENTSPITVSAPTDLAATPGNGQVALSWNDDGTAVSYEVLRGTSSGSEIVLATPPIYTTSYVDATAVNGTTYYYEVVALNGTFTSGPSNEASAKPLAGSITAPTGLTAIAGDTQVALAWNPDATAVSYNVLRGDSPGGEGATPINTSPITGTSFIDTGLTNGHTYYYEVVAVNGTVASGPSNEASVTPLVTGAATKLAFLTQPGNAFAGSAFGNQPVVITEDSAGHFSNLGLSSSDLVTMTLTTGSGTLSGTMPLDIGSSFGNGIVSFTDLSINTPDVGDQLTATATGLFKAVSNLFNVSATDNATQLAFLTEPGNAVAGSAFGTQPVLITEDSSGHFSNVGLPASDNVTMTLTAGSGTLLGNVTLDIGSAAGNGVISYSDLEIDAAANGKQLTATAAKSTPALTAAVSNLFSVTVGPANKLVFGQQPTSTIATVSPPVTVLVEDSSGNLETSDNTTQVTLSEASGPAKAYVSQTATAVNGVVTFGQATSNPIIITTLGTYTLQATSTGLTSDTSDPFTILSQPNNVGTFRPGTTAIWFLDEVQGSYDASTTLQINNFGTTGDIAVSGDWLGTGLSYVGVFRPSTGAWYLSTTNTSYTLANTIQINDFGISGDIPMIGRWGQNPNIDYIGVFRPSTHQWFLDEVLGSYNRTTTIEIDNFGNPGDQPVVGNWGGSTIINDSRSYIGVFRPSTHQWFLDEVQGNYDKSTTIEIDNFGNPGDVAKVGNWLGGAQDGHDYVGVFRPVGSNGNSQWFLSKTNTNYSLSNTLEIDNFGTNGDIAQVGDWLGTGFTEVGVFRQSTHAIWYLSTTNTNYSQLNTIQINDFGTTGDQPAVGAWAIPSPEMLMGLPGSGTASLADAELHSIVTAAIARWQAAGLDSAGVAVLDSLQISLGDLPTGWLGAYVSGSIVLDPTAAGDGWSADTTAPPAAGQVDALTVVMHEMGHALGLPDEAVGVMAESLAPGTRSLPTAEDVAAAFASGRL
jgi:hypothetical protein